MDCSFHMGKVPDINIKSDFKHICFSNDLHVS